ncbi:NAD(P)-dependent alcohol dehydrogenase [Persicitalea jodogahamensis]|uniref:NADPH:quinone reductase n=1 Tax=Persicitalea jodogahamensis TaxID=402147 RepID=A0A8J3D5N9_9BACT|nr:NAD(P)-dependent alcohol dehydrogenase [Persicitalea jodogahamensis]GHB78564.1 NADPH:quinone reductase [Persicitalea jodogahamensis]
MKAAIIEHYGSPEEFKIKELPTPKIDEGEILIRNRASSVNPIDTIVRKGTVKLVSGLIGDQLLGSDFSGTVLASKSERFKVGDEVFGLNSALKGGSYAQEIVADAQQAAIKPAGLSFAEAASLPLVGLTAWQGMVKDGKMKSGDRVLITGCTGGVGYVAVQIAKALGAHVTGTCSAKHLEFAKSLGTDELIAYDQAEIPKDRKFDLIFDASGHYTISDMKENLTDDAMFVSTKGGADGFKGALDAATDLLFQKRMKIVKMNPNAHDLEKLAELVNSGKLTTHIAQSFPLEQIAAAHRMLEDESFKGKITIHID